MAEDSAMFASRDHSDRWAEAVDEWSAWMIAGGNRRLTIELRRYQLRNLAEDHLRRSPWSLRHNDLVTWLGQQDWAPETRRSYYSALRSFYSWAIKAGHIKTKADPTEDLIKPTAPKTAPRPVPDQILDAALADATDRDRLILMLAAYAGLRRAEIAGMRWDEIEAGIVWVADGKGGKPRDVPLHPVLVEQLGLEQARRLAGQMGTGWRYSHTVDPTSDYVFPGIHGGHIRADSLGKAASKALGAGWTAHTLRARFATRGYAGTRDLFAGQAALGHSKPETTKRYTDVPADAMLAFVQAAGM